MKTDKKGIVSKAVGTSGRGESAGTGSRLWAGTFSAYGGAVRIFPRESAKRILPEECPFPIG